MLKDYYKILGITPAATQEEIKKAYRSQSMRWHPDKNPGMDTTAEMQDINEAYNILKDPITRARYDAEYARFNSTRFEQQESDPKAEASYDIKDETLKEDIKEARKAAEDYVREFYASLKNDTKKAARGAWDEVKGFVIVSIIMSIIVTVVVICTVGQTPTEKLAELNSIDYTAMLNDQTSHPAMSPVTTVFPPAETGDAQHWKRQTFYGAFSVAVPVTIERQTKDSPYGRQLARGGYQFRDDVVIFYQKGLGNLTQKAQNQYCRFMFSYYEGDSGDFIRRDETEYIDSDYSQLLCEIVEAEIDPNARLIGSINYQWVRVNNANAIMVTYRRTGNNFDYSIPVSCRMLLLQDNNRFVKMILSYRENEANLWAEDFEQVIRSFEWIN